MCTRFFSHARSDAQDSCEREREREREREKERKREREATGKDRNVSSETGDLPDEDYPICLFCVGRYIFLAKRRRASFSYVPISRVDPRSFPRVVIDEVHFSVEVLGDVPPFRKRYLPIPSPWHISLRSKSIQNLSLYRRAVDGRIFVRADARFSSRIHGTLARRPRCERTGQNETGRRRGMEEEEKG